MCDHMCDQVSQQSARLLERANRYTRAKVKREFAKHLKGRTTQVTPALNRRIYRKFNGLCGIRLSPRQVRKIGRSVENLNRSKLPATR